MEDQAGNRHIPLSRIITLMQIFGLRLPLQSGNVIAQRLHTMYCALIVLSNLFQWLKIIQLVLIHFTNETDSETDFVSTLVIFTQTGVIFFTSFNLLLSYNAGEELMRRMRVLLVKADAEQYRKFNRLSVGICTTVGIYFVISVLGLGFISFYPIFDRDLLWKTALPFSNFFGEFSTNWGFSHDTALRLISFAMFMITNCSFLQRWVIWLFLLFMCYVLKCKYADVNKSTNRLVDNSTQAMNMMNTDNEESNGEVGVTGHSIGEIRQKHEQVTQAVLALDDYLSIALGMACGLVISVLIMMVYFAERGRDGSTKSFSLSMYLIFTTIDTIIIIWSSIVVNAMAHKPLHKLYQIQLKQGAQQEANQLQLWISRLTAPAIGLTAAGFFVIDKPALLTIAGTIMTYTIVVFQFPSCPTEAAAFTAEQLYRLCNTSQGVNSSAS